MKHLIYKHTSKDGESMTVHKSGQSWLSCLGQIDEQLVRYCGEDASILAELSDDLEHAVERFNDGRLYYGCTADPADHYTLTPTDQPAKVEAAAGAINRRDREGCPMKHTLGPWAIHADPEHVGKHPLHDNRYIVTEGTEFDETGVIINDGSIICQMRDTQCQAADARLIAAAPELLAVLKDLLEWEAREGGLEARCWKDARTAIDKAT